MAIFQMHKDTTIVEKVFLLVFQNQVSLFALVEHCIADLLYILLILSQELFQPRSYGLFRSHNFILRGESSRFNKEKIYYQKFGKYLCPLVKQFPRGAL